MPIAAQYVVTFLKPEMLHVYRQITALQTWKPMVLCQKRENADRFPFADTIVLAKPRTHQLRRFWQKTLRRRPITIYRSEARRILQELQQMNAGVLHIYFGHIGVHLLPLLELAAQPHGGAPACPPIIVSFHGADAQIDLDRPAHRVATQRMFALASRLLVRSESLAERLVAHGAPPEKIRLHRTGLPLGEIPFRRREVPIEGDWQILQACRLIAKKGLATTLRAFAGFAARWPKARLVIAGEGPQLESLQQLAAQLGIAAKVEFKGFVAQADLRALEAQSHFFLHPSELGPDGDQEGVPNSMLEAMASGLPVLATRHGGIPEAIIEGASGILVPERDSTSLANAMLALADDHARYAALGAAAAARVAAEFDLAAQTRRLEAIYDEVALRQA